MRSSLPTRVVQSLVVLASIAGTAEASDFVEISKIGQVTFGREALTGYLEIREGNQKLTLDVDNRINFHLHGAFEFNEKRYILVYDTATNVPSGKRLSRGAEGSDLYEVEISNGRAEFKLVAVLPVGIDMQLRTSQVYNSFFACGTTACLRLSSDLRDPPTETIQMPHGYEIVELSGYHVLLQKVFNDQVEKISDRETSIFAVCELAADVPKCVDIPPDQIPYKLKADGSYITATKYQDVLQYDYNRLGMANFSNSNLEARQVWSNVYFLCGLAAAHQLPFDDNFRAEVKIRLADEMRALARLGESRYPGFKVRRYSMDREPIDILLHLSRIAKTAERSRPVVGDELADRVLATVISEVRRPTQTIEEIAEGELRITPGMPFWADGSNVPWNFQSAWIEALALTDNLHEHKRTVEAMIRNFEIAENLGPQSEKWGYAGGLFFEGWSEGVSTNTPTYAGQKNSNLIAHISYRSMDALALLEAERDGVSVPISDDRIASLISEGLLYPFVNEGLKSPVVVPFHVARHYARSSLPWHFQNQVWAIWSLQSSGATSTKMTE